MKIYVTKVRYILPTFLTVVFATGIGLAVLRWLFFIQFQLFEVKQEVWEIWLPLIIPWIPISIWLRKRFRILTFKKEADSRRFIYQLISWGTMTAMLMASQSYLTTATGKLIVLKHIHEIDSVEKVRYYKLSKFSIARHYGGSYTDFRTSGKYNENLNFNVYFVAPILSDSNEQLTTVPQYWYGVKFSKQISNKIRNEEKESKYHAFFHECISKMNNYRFHSLDHFKRAPASDDRNFFFKAIESRIKQTANNNLIILEPVSESYESRNGNKLPWVFGWLGIGLCFLLLVISMAQYDGEEHKRQLQGKKPKHDDILDMLNYLIPKGEHFATSILIDLNILVFLIMVFSGVNIISPNGHELLQWGANRRLETTGGEWWRLFTSIFLHGGIMHLFLNIYGLSFAGIFVEPLFGRRKFIFLYVLSGLAGSLASIWWYQNTISMGASGAIFGLFGAILGLLFTNTVPAEGRKTFLLIISSYVGINLLWGLTGGIDNAAHIGGLLSGAIIGILFYKFGNTKKKSA
jgi:rhomboid protease GluP